jgi:hypothetical protein
MNAGETIPLSLLMLAEYAADQPDLAQLERALDAARTILQMRGDSLPREEARQRFIEEEGERGDANVKNADRKLMTAAQVSFGDPAFFYGMACAWLLLRGSDGVR